MVLHLFIKNKKWDFNQQQTVKEAAKQSLNKNTFILLFGLHVSVKQISGDESTPVDLVTQNASVSIGFLIQPLIKANVFSPEIYGGKLSC